MAELLPRRIRTRLLALSLALAAPLLAAPPASAAPGASAHTVVRSATQIRDYWTPERMRSAIPAAVLAANPQTPALSAEPRAGEPRTVREAPRATEVPDARSKPYRTHGKVFFRQSGIDYVCSGTVVNARSRSLVATAGHCLSANGTYASNFMFVPAYRDNLKPFGEWTARRLATTKQFLADDEDVRYDVGYATMRPRKNGRRIQEVVGARGIAFNRSRSQHYRIFGYPEESPFNGERLFRCISDYQGPDNRQPAPTPMRIECAMTGGSSGGGFVIHGRYVNSVISYYYPCFLLNCHERGKLFGPYFGSVVESLYRAERRLGRNR